MAAASPSLDSRRGFRLEDLRTDEMFVHKAVGLTGMMTYKQAWNATHEGRITVDGVVATEKSKCFSHQRIELDGVALPPRQPLVYYLLYKPRCVLTTCGVGENAKIGEKVKSEIAGGTITDWVPAAPRVTPVGRLDYESEGAIILTNDGSLSKSVASPSFQMLKEYVCLVVSRKHPGRPGVPTDAEIQSLATQGVRNTQSGTLYQAESAAVIDADADSGHALVRVSLREGKNREVRRLLWDTGYRVLTLTRTTIGPLRDVVEWPRTAAEAVAMFETLERDAKALMASADGQTCSSAGDAAQTGRKNKRHRQLAQARVCMGASAVDVGGGRSDQNLVAELVAAAPLGPGLQDEQHSLPQTTASTTFHSDDAALVDREGFHAWKVARVGVGESVRDGSQWAMEEPVANAALAQPAAAAATTLHPPAAQMPVVATGTGPGCKFHGFAPSVSSYKLLPGQVRMLTVDEVATFYRMMQLDEDASPAACPVAVPLGAVGATSADVTDGTGRSGAT